MAPLLWAACNHIDKILLEKYFKEGGVGAVLIVSALASSLAIPFLYLANPAVLEVDSGNFDIIIVTAILDIVVLWAYLNAVQKDDPSRVVVYYQLLPVLGIGTGWLFLGETITGHQLIAMAIVLLGTTILSFDEAGGVVSFKWRTVGYMLLAVSAWAMELAIFKAIAIEEDPWRTLFWKHVVLVTLGVLMYALISKYRKSFLAVMRENSTVALGLAVSNEVLYMTGTILYGLAAMSAPVALVLLTETFQSVFVLIIAVALAWFLPQFATENVEIRHLARKAVAIGITGLGTYLLLVA